MTNALRRYLLPGFIFQSVVIAGGYGTGRELAEYFLSHGPAGGLLAMAVSTVVWSVVCIAVYEFARTFKVFEYRSFFRLLLGRRWWFTFEILYITMLMLVLAVIAASAGSILQETFGLPYGVGVVGIMALVGLLVFGGNEVIEKAFSSWSGVLYLIYFVFFVWCASRFGPEIGESFAAKTVVGNWFWDGLRYAGYNLGVMPAVLITIRHHRNRRDTFIAGLLTGPIAMLPALFFFVAIAGEYPGILGEAVPVNHMLELINSRPFQIAFQVMLFGTLVETGAGMIHALNERIAHAAEERGRALSAGLRAASAVVVLALGALIAQFGLTALVAQGYGYITYGWWAVFIVPVTTWGVYMVRRERRRQG